MGLGKLIKTTVRKITRWANSDPERYYPQDVAMPTSIGSNSSDFGDRNGMNFTVFPACGGKVIKFSKYNPSTDRNKVELYIVTDKEDLGNELSLIITKESLTR